MNSQDQPILTWKDGTIGAGLSVFVGLACLFFPLENGLTDLSYDLPYVFRPRVPIDEVAIVYMDDESHRILEQPSMDRWDRSLHTQLVERLAASRAKAVAFDILFEGIQTNDPPFFRAIQAATNAGTVVVVSGTANSVAFKGENAMWQVTAPFDEEVQSRLPWGLVEVGGGNRTLRRHFRGVDDYPTLAWRVAELTLTQPPSPRAATRWFSYYGPPGTIPHHSFHRVISTDAALAISPMAFSNKVVFVGANVGLGFTGGTGTGTDHFRTPYSHRDENRYPGTEVNATAYLNLKNRDWLNRLDPLAEVLMVVGLGSLFGFGLTLCRPMPGVGLALLGQALLGIVACLVVWQAQVWFAWMIVVGVQIPVALGWSVLSHSKRLHREKELLEQKLAMPSLDIIGGETVRRGHSSVATVGSVSVGPDCAEGEPYDPPSIPDHTLLRCIGKGAYGEVWLARSIIETYHAVKVVRRRSFSSDGPFDREFKGIQRFMPISRLHPGLVHILHVGRSDTGNYIYCIMEVGDDESTGQQIDPDHYRPKNLGWEIRQRGRISAMECLRLGLELSVALDFLHQQQLIHRDIKPSNIIFVRGMPKLADIGLVTDVATPGKDVSYLGTDGYIAPEGPGTPAADVFSLGKVLYQASTGLDLKDFPELPDSMLLSPDKDSLFELNEIIIRACQADPRLRYQSAGELHADLARLRKGEA